MRRKENRRAVRNVLDRLDERETALFKLFNDDLVVYKFVKAIEGRV